MKKNLLSYLFLILLPLAACQRGGEETPDNPGGGTIFFITLPVAEVIEEAIVMED